MFIQCFLASFYENRFHRFLDLYKDPEPASISAVPASASCSASLLQPDGCPDTRLQTQPWVGALDNTRGGMRFVKQAVFPHSEIQFLNQVKKEMVISVPVPTEDPQT